MIRRSEDGAGRVFGLVSSVSRPDSWQCLPRDPSFGTAGSPLYLCGSGLTRFQRLSGWRLDGQGRLARLLALHRFAIEAEIEGRWARADFFWTEVHAKLARPVVREDLAAMFGRGLTRTGDNCELGIGEIYRHLLDEVFVDTHCAFYNGYWQQTIKATPKSRQFCHLDYLAKLLDVSGASTSEQSQLLGEATEQRISVCRDSGDWNQAVELASSLLKRFPDRLEYQEMRASLEFARATHALKESDSESANLSEAAGLEPATDALDKMCEAYPSTASAYELAGRLHRIRGTRLVKGGKISDAMVEIEKAAAYDSGLEGITEDRTRLAEMMENLQKQMRVVQAAIAARSNATLSYQGQQLKQEAEKGSGAALAYQRSQHAKTVAERAQKAQLRTIWRRIGLAEPADRWDERANCLGRALNSIIALQAKDMSAVDRQWKSMIESDPDLAALDFSLISQFLGKRLFPSTETTSEPPPALVLPVSKAERRSQIPFAYWVFNGGDLRTKIQSALAVVLLLLAVALTTRDASLVRVREKAWQQIQESSLKGDDIGVITGSESFFSASPRKDDRRLTGARTLYQAAILRWFSRLPGEPDANALYHIRRYRSLVGHSLPKEVGNNEAGI